MMAGIDLTTDTPPTSNSIDSPVYRWYVLGLLFMVATLNAADRYMVAALTEPLKIEFNLTDSEIGFLAGLIFAIAYTSIGVPLGFLIDRVNRSRMLAILVAIWSGATFISGVMTSYWGLVAARLGVAAAEAGGNPTSLSLISDLFSKERRGLAIGIFSVHSAIGSLIAFSTASFVAAHWGWRAAFFVAGAPGLLISFLLFLTLREPVRGGFDRPSLKDVERIGAMKTLRAFAGNRVLVYLTIAAVLVVAGVAGTTTFTASFLTREHGLPLARAGALTGIIIAATYGTGALAGGFMSDLAFRKSPGGGCYLVALLMFLAAPSAAAGYLSKNLIVSLALVTLAQFFIAFYFAATYSAVFRAVPVHMRGSAIGLVMVLLNVGGYGLGPAFSGGVSDLLKNAGSQSPLSVSLACTSIVFIFASFFYFLAGRQLEQQARGRNTRVG
jgi:predicted MFS family arabinose efflux permease